MNRTASNVDDLEQPLREALAHFYDPSYQPPEKLLKTLGMQAQQGSETLWQVLINTIEGLKPNPDIPATSHVWRLYNILVCRYIKNMTQEETAEHLGISPRHLRREQQLAVGVLARKLLEQKPVAANLNEDKVTTPPQTSWSSQVKQELASLQKNSPGAISNVRGVVLKVLERSQTLTAKHGVRMGLENVQSNLTVTLHPSVLQQMLVEVVEDFLHHHIASELTFRAEQREQNVVITMSSVMKNDAALSVSDFAREILNAEGGFVKTFVENQQAFFELTLPSARQITVLVVDDNQDLVHFYKRYTANTKYHIHHVSEGHEFLETVLQLSPNVILLDVMLPDTDGWELLTKLQNHPVTRSIPVIVCSVMKGEDFASVLGATKFLAKPVGRQKFLEALEQVSSNAPQ
jgi:CheY-like chemotaxis protein